LRAWTSVCSECCVLSGRRLCDELTINAEESYRLWCVVECDLEASWMWPWPTGGAVAPKTNIIKDKTNNCLYRYGNLLYYKQRNLLHVSATCCHPQGGLWRVIT
jgi:hypothetical protein